MRYIEIIEAVRPNTLYHATTVDRLYEILDENMIKPNTGHPITHTGGERRSTQWAIRPTDITPNGYLKGVSLTRSVVFARSWKSTGVILVLDGDLIRQNLRLIPISFFGGRRPIAHEAEEFVIGPIQPLSQYLLYIEASQQTVDANPFLSQLALFDPTPRLQIVGGKWRGTGLNKGTVDNRVESPTNEGIMKLTEIFDDEEDEDRFNHLPSVAVIKPLRPQMAIVAQRVYDRWTQGENDDLNGGGICHLIADEIASILSDVGVPIATQCSTYEQHVYCIAQCQEGIFEIDIPYQTYEHGGGFSWTKLPDVHFTSDDIVISKLDHDPGRMGQYVEDWQED
jgi:hypothetical protein